MSGGNADLCAKAVRSMRRAVADCNALDVSPDEAAGIWTATMAIRGIRPLTMRRYLESVRALFNKAGIPFSFEATLPSPATRSHPVLPAVRRLAEKAPGMPSPLRLAVDTLLLGLYAGGLALEDVAGLRLDSAETDGLMRLPQAKEIIDRHAAPRRKYLLPLSQGRRTLRQIAAELRRRLAAISPELAELVAPDGTQGLTDDDGLRNLALRLTIDAGLTITEAAAFTGRTVAGLVAPPDADEEELERLRRHVADAVSDPRPRWYAMRLRRGVSPESIADRLAEDSPRSKILQTYYPCEEIARRVGKKLSVKTRAYISDVLFFRSDPAGIRPLFRHIGDLAWCYRTSPDPAAPYAAISDRDMRAFQRRIGQFTEDMELLPADQAPDFTLGQRVRIATGPMAGYEGEVLTLPQGNRRMLRLALTSDRGLLLTLTIPSPSLQPL